jgi:putative ABC transport system permease protein
LEYHKDKNKNYQLKTQKDRFAIFMFRFLKWFCPDRLYEEIEGDLLQKFNGDFKKFSKRKAELKLLWNVISFFRPGILFRNKFSFEIMHFFMIWTYFKLAARTLIRNKVFSTINVLGLTVSMVLCMLIFQYVRFELSYDDFHNDAHNIYRVATKVTLQDQLINHETNTYEGIRSALRSDFPGVKAATTIRQFTSDRNFIRYENKDKQLVTLQSFKALDVDSTFFGVFSFEVINGNSSILLRDPYSVVISETLSKQCFSGDAVGKYVEIYDGEKTKQYKITGVLKDIPFNSHIKFDLLTRSEPRNATFWNGDVGFWDWSGQTYIRLTNQSVPAELESKLAALAASNNGLKRNKDDYGQLSTFELQPLTDIHLFSHLQEELEINGSGTLVYGLMVLAMIIMAVAWINYINLSTAISESKIKSIGVRKVVGATRFALILQVLTESAMFNMLSVVIAITVVALFLPAFSGFSGIPLDYSVLYDKWLLISSIAFVLVGTFMSGIYPAVAISSFYPVRALKAKVAVRGFPLRRAMVIFQFGAAVILIVITVVAYEQLSYMRNKELGITTDQVVIVKALNFDKETWSNNEGGYRVDSAYLLRANLFKEDIRSHSGFVNATSLSHLPGQLPNWGTEFKAESIDSERAYRLSAVGIDYDFLSTLGVKLLAGRNFSTDFPADRGNEGRRAILINEAASKLLGFKAPEAAINQHITTYWGADYEIIGVVNSFHQLSLKENLQPIYFLLQPRALDYFAIQYTGENTSAAIEELGTIWQRHFPDYPFNYFFLDKYFDQQYHYDEQFRDVMSLFSGVTMFIAFLGLFGITSYAIVQRTKEIGIRKVLGATAANIIGLFTNDFARPILLANAIAIPLVYFLVTLWLENYAYKITLSWWLFTIPMIVVLFIALVAIGLQAIKIAVRNPVDSLRHE